MINYIKVKDHLLALNELPEVKGFIPKTWKFVSDNLVNKYDEELFEKAIEGRIQDIFDELISAPTGLSLNRKKIPQFIGIIVLILDDNPSFKT
jgi:predicted metalloprotease with PDZ domain